ncbi:LysR family transcriptional regulator [Pseudomonas sp. NA-150]|uniref:LysR family transcriptional regulator n=1 Tax=Pseudomonas sp. NA-150 TaxID=3367525 RepID=UPI0037C7A3FA
MRVNLNLLVVFMVVFRELNVSRAAEQLSIGQPAVSGSLARLRERFDDQLFIRSGRGVRPTKRAVEIADALLPAMNAIGVVVDGFTAI